MELVYAYGIDLAALVVAAVAFVVARSQGPTAWARRVQDVELELADQAERFEALQASVTKWRSRQAARERRSGDPAEREGVEPYTVEPGEPDPLRNPAAWKQWVNSGGIHYLKGRKRNA